MVQVITRTHRHAVPPALLLALSAAAASDSGPQTPLATLEGKLIYEADFQQYLRRTSSPERLAELQRSASDRQGALDEYLDTLAIVTKARRAGIGEEVRFKKALELMEMKALSQLVIERHRDRLRKAAEVPRAELKAFYERHKAELVEEPRFTAHHVLVYVEGNPAFPEKGLADQLARARAEKALLALRAGERWEVVARSFSDEVPTNQHAGLIRDAQFGYFAPEMEQAVRSQALGRPGNVIRSAFGYHVLEVVERTLERAPQPFERVKEMLTDRLARARAEKARVAVMAPIAREVGFKMTEAGTRDVPLLDEKAVAPDEVLAEVGGRKVLESDFRWFLKDAVVPEQRTSAYARPSARSGMLGSYLDMLVLEAKARKDGLDRTESFELRRTSMQESLLTEFMRARDRVGPFCGCQQTDEARHAAQREYSERVRAEMGLEVARGYRELLIPSSAQ